MLRGTLFFLLFPALTLAVNIVRDGYFKPSKGEKIAELKNWGETFHIEFFINLHQKNDFKNWINILHFTTGENICNGCRIPGIWVKGRKLYVYTEFSGNNNLQIVGKDLAKRLQRVIVSQQWVNGKLMLKILQEGEVIFNKENTSGRNREKVKVYLSDPWHESSREHAYLYHLKISDKAPPSDTHLQLTDIGVSKGKLLTTLKNFGKTYHVEFIFKKTDTIGTGYTNILHMSRGEDNKKEGDRFPAVWMYQTEKLYVSSLVNGEKNKYVMTPPTYPDMSYHVIISQDSSGQYQVFFNGERVTSIKNKKTKSFPEIKLYVSDPWYSGVNSIGDVTHLVVSDVIPESGRYLYV